LCERVAAVAKNSKRQKSGGVSHHGRLHEPAGCNLLNSNPTLSTWRHPFFLKSCLALSARALRNSADCVQRPFVQRPRLRARKKPRSLRCGLRTKERYPGRPSHHQTTTPRRHQFHSSLTPLHAHYSTRETLRVDLAQTGAVPMRLSNSATMRTTLRSFARSGFQCCGNTLTSTRLFFSIVEKCLAFATGRKNRPTDEAPSSRPPRPFWAGRDAPVLWGAASRPSISTRPCSVNP